MDGTQSGQFQRMPTQFRHQITADGSSGFKAEPTLPPLHFAGCPWAHRTALLWKLKGLEEVVGLSIVDSVISDQVGHFQTNMVAFLTP